MICEKKSTKRSSPAIDYVCSILIFFCLCGFLQSRFFGGHFAGTACGVLYLAADFAAQRLSVKKKIVKSLPIFLLILSFAFSIFSLTAHLAELANEILTACFIRFHTSVRLFDSAKYSFFADCALGSSAALCVSAAVRTKKKAVKILCALTVLAAAALFAESVFQAICAAGAAAVLLISCEKNASIGHTAARAALTSAAFFLFFSCGFSARAADTLIAAIENARYRGEGFSLPNGDLAHSEMFDPQGTASLEVVMDSPQPMYLHGFLGYDYCGGAWKEPDFSDLTGSIDEICCLENSGFYADSQPAKLISAAESTENFGTVSVTVNNIGADKRYGYLPCAVFKSGFDGEKTALGLENRVGFLSENSVYTVQTAADLTEKSGEFSDIAAEIYEKNDENADDYVKNSVALDGIYRENFTSVSDDVRRILDVQLRDYQCESGDISGAANVIYDYLGGFSYDTGAENLTLEDFLQVTKSGYSVHFASAAAEIFRYYGIPARYAEGYAVTYGDADGKLSGSPIVLTDENFHAWAEVYLTGVGWIPFEATPEYFAKMPLPDGVSVSEDGAFSPYAPQSGGAAQAVSGERTALSQPDEEAVPERDLSPAWFALAAALLALVFAAVNRVRAAGRMKKDHGYAVYRCVRLLSDIVPLAAGTDGNYDFSAVPDSALSAELSALQNECIKELYAHNIHNASPDMPCSDGYAIYRKCLRFAGEKKSVLARSAAFFKELFSY